MAGCEPQSASTSARRWYRHSPGHLIVAFLAVEALLWFSERFQWFAFNRHKGWTALIAVAGGAAAILLLLAWLAVGLLIRRRFQFSLRLLLVMTLGVAILCSWLATDLQRAKRQKEAVVATTEINGKVYHDYQVVAGDAIDPRILPPGSAWLRSRLGDEYFADVIAVDVRGPAVTDEFIGHLKSFPRLRWLVLRGTEVSESGLEEIAALRCLRSLSLDATPVTVDGVEHIATLINIRTLGLAYTGITDTGLVRLELLTDLEVLDLAGNVGVTDRGMNHVGRLGNLRRLSLRHCEVTDAGLTQLHNLQKLEEIDLWYTQVTPSAIMDFKRRFPAVEIAGSGVAADGAGDY